MNKIMGFYIGTYGGSMNASQVVITTPTQLPDMVVGSAYSIILTAENGTPPYVWSASDGRQLLGIDYLAIDPDGRVWASAENTSLVSPGGSGSTGILVHDAAGSFAIKGIQIRTVNATG